MKNDEIEAKRWELYKSISHKNGHSNTFQTCKDFCDKETVDLKKELDRRALLISQTKEANRKLYDKNETLEAKVKQYEEYLTALKNDLSQYPSGAVIMGTKINSICSNISSILKKSEN